VKVRRVCSRRGEVKLQGIGWARVWMHRPPIGSRVCQATWTVEPDGIVFVSVLLFEVHKRRPSKPRAPPVDSRIGVDRGVEVAVATSDGEPIDRDIWTDGSANASWR